jgi:hypothetical protein
MQMLLPSLLCASLSGGDPGMPLTARVERGPSEAARSASTKGSLVAPASFLHRAITEMQMLPPSSLVVPLGRAPLVGPTAAVERAHSDRARSGSKEPTGVSFRPFMLGCRACRR